jgi:hypothetical protein
MRSVEINLPPSRLQIYNGVCSSEAFKDVIFIGQDTLPLCAALSGSWDRTMRCGVLSVAPPYRGHVVGTHAPRRSRLSQNP